MFCQDTYCPKETACAKVLAGVIQVRRESSQVFTECKNIWFCLQWQFCSPSNTLCAPILQVPHSLFLCFSVTQSRYHSWPLDFIKLRSLERPLTCEEQDKERERRICHQIYDVQLSLQMLLNFIKQLHVLLTDAPF